LQILAALRNELTSDYSQLNEKLDQIASELEGEPRKAALGQADRALDEAKEIVSAISGITAMALNVSVRHDRMLMLDCTAGSNAH
jgi:hypothetical protein